MNKERLARFLLDSLDAYAIVPNRVIESEVPESLQEDSYFADCPRDEEGRCKASAGGDESGKAEGFKDAADKKRFEDASARHEGFKDALDKQRFEDASARHEGFKDADDKRRFEKSSKATDDRERTKEPVKTAKATAPTSHDKLHNAAHAKAQSLLAKAASVPKALATKAINVTKNLYGKMEAKYGPRWAKAIVATAIITMPTPFTLGSVAGMTALAHVWTQYVSPRVEGAK